MWRLADCFWPASFFATIACQTRSTLWTSSRPISTFNAIRWLFKRQVRSRKVHAMSSLCNHFRSSAGSKRRTSHHHLHQHSQVHLRAATSLEADENIRLRLPEMSRSDRVLHLWQRLGVRPMRRRSSRVDGSVERCIEVGVRGVQISAEPRGKRVWDGKKRSLRETS